MESVFKKKIPYRLNELINTINNNIFYDDLKNVKLWFYDI